jgi:CubicO group peptidase (beta-lactamase class C family)
VLGSLGGELTDRVVTWTSGDPNIATVSGAGQVTGLTAGGPVVITATAGGVSGTADVTFVAAPTRLAFTVQPGNVQVGSALTPAVVVSATDAAGNVATSFSGTITIAIGNNPGGSTLGGTRSIAAQNGMARFTNLTLDRAGTGYTLSASASGLTSVTSRGFDVTASGPGPATRLAFTVQPSNATAGSVLTPSVKVTALDASGAVATSFSGTITVALGANPGGSTLGGTKTRAAQSGVATFGNLTLDQAGSGYTLNATGTNLTAATSSPFDITAPPSGPYYPPPASSGGWRSHVVLGQTPSPQAKQDILRDTGVDWNTLAQAWGIVSSYGGSFVVIRNGWVIGEWGDAGSGGAEVASVTKSLTSMAMGKIFDLSASGGLPSGITLSSPAVQFLPPSWNDVPAKQNIQLRHMMTMSSGLRQNDYPYTANWLNVILSEPVVAPAGTVYAYTSAAVDLLSLIIEDITGQTLGTFFANQIGNPIGVRSLRFGQFSGHSRAASGAHINARDLARIAYLLLRKGVWDSGNGPRQILRSSTVSTHTRRASLLGSTSFQTDRFQDDPQSRQRYGHLFWTNRNGSNLLGASVPTDAYYMAGFGSQFVMVIPSLDMIIVRRSINPQPWSHSVVQSFTQKIMEAVVAP